MTPIYRHHFFPISLYTNLLELLDCPLIDPTQLINQVAGRRRLPGVHMANHHKVDMRLLFPHLQLGQEEELLSK